ncbi:hypothetical protein S245_020640, partial [Arachis hypogaea]
IQLSNFLRENVYRQQILRFIFHSTQRWRKVSQAKLQKLSLKHVRQITLQKEWRLTYKNNEAAILT